MDLGLNNLVVAPGQLWAGEPVTVSWSGANRTGAPLLGDWIDGVYLSADDKWDINDTCWRPCPTRAGWLKTRGTRAVTALVPGKLPGNYQILVRADIANQERESNKADNVIASAAFPLDVHKLAADGTPVHGSLSSGDRADYYAIQVGDPASPPGCP